MPHDRNSSVKRLRRVALTASIPHRSGRVALQGRAAAPGGHRMSKSRSSRSRFAGTRTAAQLTRQNYGGSRGIASHVYLLPEQRAPPSAPSAGHCGLGLVIGVGLQHQVSHSIPAVESLTSSAKLRRSLFTE